MRTNTSYFFDYFQALPHSGSENFNYKDFHSLILMAICDAKLKFIFIDFGGKGRRGDGNVFYHCSFGKRMRLGMLNTPPPIPCDGFRHDQDVPFVFVGDAAFSGNPNIISPVKGRFLQDEVNVFNYRVSRARRIVENAFGIMASRFRILQTMIIGSAALIKSIVLACAALHNYHLMDEDSIPPKSRRYNEHGLADHVMRNGRLQQGRWRTENKIKEKSIFNNLKHGVCVVENLGCSQHQKLTAEKVQDLFMEYFVDNAVPWQWQSAHVI